MDYDQTRAFFSLFLQLFARWQIRHSRTCLRTPNWLILPAAFPCGGPGLGTPRLGVFGKTQIQGQQGLIRDQYNTDSVTHGPDFDDLGLRSPIAVITVDPKQQRLIGQPLPEVPGPNQR